MNWRWYITGVIVALAFFGMSLGQSTTNPNQEIVVRFNAASINSDEVQLAIADIRSQLKSIGIENVHVSEIVNGKLKVTYFSDKDVAVIKDLFLHQNKLQLGDTAFNEKEGPSKLPFNKNSNTYKLDVIKIQQNPNSDVGFHGTLVDIKSLNDQYLKPIVSLATSEVTFSLKYLIKREACKIYPDIRLLINNSAYKIPEVRAGPLAQEFF
ncbi:hypothetical protein [Aequorivita capsosiphonis]|uniref:hypothetical protein n=1 Tax=Aequorivita capsosiphonis TaxID=487317 RepID=UPI0012F8DEEB|nr:hypothetical protein [Aequorivita capsosiphonis]